MHHLEKRDDVLISEGLDALEKRVKTLKRQRREQTRYNERLREDVEVAGNAAVDIRKKYKKLVSSRAVAFWITIRKLVGRPIAVVDEPVAKSFKAPCYTLDDVNVDFAQECERQALRLASSNGSSYYTKSPVRAGIITDEYMYNYYDKAIDLVYLPASKFKTIINEEKLDFVIYVTGWKGMDDADYAGPKGVEAAAHALAYARERGIPTIFQSIEDPPNYERFLPIAKEADVIFTSAEEMVDCYKGDTKCKNISALLYGVNPHLQNPVDFCKKRSNLFGGSDKGVFFAGSWASRYPERCKMMRILFDGVIDADGWDLHVADRNLLSAHHADYAFPRVYVDSIMPPIEHHVLQRVHKLFDFTLNLNSVTDSATMCAMRAYEVQALGSLMLTNYAYSVSRSFPGLFTVFSSDEVARVLGGYGDDELVSLQIEGVRDVYSGGTVYDRLNQVFEAVGIEERFPVRPVYVAFEEDTDEARAFFERQICPGKVALAAGEVPPPGGGFMVRLPGSGLPASPVHLLDMVNAFKFVDVDYVAYVAAPRWEGAYELIGGRPSPTGSLFDLSSVPASAVASGELPEGLVGFGVAEPRWGRDTSGQEKELAVIVPVHNNGRYLWKRCFRSLLRSSVFDRMRVYLVDDGSTDGLTPEVVRWIASAFDNVEAFFFGDGGSGSASRARNKGFELSSEPFVTYLDPDNEAVCDGYAQLLEDVRGNDVDFAFGPILKVVPRAPHVSELRWCDEEGVVECGPSALARRGFRTQSIQGCVIRRELIERGGIVSPVGAVGQDTLFFYEMVVHARRAYHRRLPIHVYYADREGSAVNAVGPSFFRKSYLCEERQVRVLDEAGLLDEYRSVKLERFLDGWYGRKLELVAEADLPECRGIVDDIRRLYE